MFIVTSPLTINRSCSFVSVTMATNFVVLALCAAFCFQIVACDSPDDIKEIAKGCKVHHAISEDELNGMKKMVLPESQEGKCFLGCILEKMGLITEGKFNKDVAEEQAKKKLAEKPDDLEKHLQLISKCNDEVASSSDKCETGPKLMACITTFAPGFGIVLPSDE